MVHFPPPFLPRPSCSQTYFEHRLVGASRHDPRVSRNPSSLKSSSSAGTIASQLGPSSGWGFDFESPGSTSLPQTRSTVLSAGFGADLPLPLLRSTEACAPEEEGTKATAKRSVGAVTAPALAYVSGGHSAALLSAAEMATGNGPSLTAPSLGRTMSAESAALAGAVFRAEAEASLVVSPSQGDEAPEETTAIGARVAAALTPWVPEEGCQRGHSPAFRSSQPDPRSQPQPPTPPTLLREPPEEGSGAHEARLSRSGCSSTDDYRESFNRPRHAEQKEQNRSSTTTVNATSTRLKGNLLEVELAEEGRGRQPVAGEVTATANEELKVCDAVRRERKATSEAAPSIPIKNVVDRRAAAKGRGRRPLSVGATTLYEDPKGEEAGRERGAISEAAPISSIQNVDDRMAAAAVAEAKVKTKGTRNRGAFGFRNVPANVASSRVGPRATTTFGMDLGPKPAVVSPASVRRKATDGSVNDDGAGRASITAIRTWGTPESHLPTGENVVGAEMRMDEKKAVDEVWARVLQDDAQAEFDVGRVSTTRSGIPAKGRSASRK